MSKRHNKKKNKAGKCTSGVDKKREEITEPAKVQVSSVSIPNIQAGAAAMSVQTNLSKDELLKIKNVMESVRISNKSFVENNKTTNLSLKIVQKMDEIARSNKPIVEDIPLDEIRKKPFSLPSGFKWETMILEYIPYLIEVSQFLSENHVEDDNGVFKQPMFRFNYSPELIAWALLPPGYLKEWHIGIRIEKSNKLVGFVGAVPSNIRIRGVEKKMVKIKFLCVNAKLRSKQLATTLIREITRRVNCQGIFQAVFIAAAGAVLPSLPSPVGNCRYWHRSLNPKKLIQLQFSHLNRNTTIQSQMKLLKMPINPTINGFRSMLREDVPSACKLLNEYLSKFKMVPVFTEEEFNYWFFPKIPPEGEYLLYNLVRGNSNDITDLISFYALNFTVLSHSTKSTIKAAYSFYNASKSHTITELMNNALIIAKKFDFDVFNALDIMENSQVFEKLKFDAGDGTLKYYIYNWGCHSMISYDIGLIL